MKYNKFNILRQINQINKNLESIDYRLSLSYNSRNRYYRNYELGITNFLYKLDNAKLDSYRNSVCNIIEDKIETNYKATCTPTTPYEWNKKYELITSFWKKFEERYTKPLRTDKDRLEKLRSQLWSKIYAHNGKQNRPYVIESLSAKMMKGEDEPIKNFSFCTKTGREIEINFKMTNPKENDYYKRNKEPSTWFEMGLIKMEGYLFNSHYKKLIHGQNNWKANPKTKLGVLSAANRPGVSQDIIDAAQELKSKMGDSIFCTYVDSGHSSSFKIKDLYIFTPQIKKVNKQLVRNKFRGKGRAKKVELILQRRLYTINYVPPRHY